MTIKAGYKIVLQFDAKTLVGYKSNNMKIGTSFGDATTGASTDQWEESVPLWKNAQFDVDGLYDPTSGSDKSVEDVIDLLIAGTSFTAKYGGTESGDKYYSASAYIESVDVNGPHDDLGSYSVNVKVSGAVSTGTV